jgi:arylsulfatase A-like enzyme
MREMGHGDRSLLVGTTDHGESFGEHGYYFGHGAYAYEATVRAAMILSLPGVVPSGLSVEAPVGTVDIMPTLLDATGVPIGERIQGHSFLPTALGLTDRSPGEFAFVQAGVVKHGALGFVSAIRSDRYKYIRRHREWGQFPESPYSWLLSLTSLFEGSLGADELYAIQDAREVDNLIGKDPAMANLLRAKVAAFLAYLGQWETPPAAQLTDPSQLDEETYEALKSLGYIK